MPPPPFYKVVVWVGFVLFFFLNKLVLTPISQSSNACLVFGRGLLSASPRTPGRAAAQEGAGHSRAMALGGGGGGGRAAGRKTEPESSAYGLHVGRGACASAAAQPVSLQPGGLEAAGSHWCGERVGSLQISQPLSALLPLGDTLDPASSVASRCWRPPAVVLEWRKANLDMDTDTPSWLRRGPERLG